MNSVRITKGESRASWKAELLEENGTAHVIPLVGLEINFDGGNHDVCIYLPQDKVVLDIQVDPEVVEFIKDNT